MQAFENLIRLHASLVLSPHASKLISSNWQILELKTSDILLSWAKGTQIRHRVNYPGWSGPPRSLSNGLCCNDTYITLDSLAWIRLWKSEIKLWPQFQIKLRPHFQLIYIVIGIKRLPNNGCTCLQSENARTDLSMHIRHGSFRLWFQTCRTVSMWRVCRAQKHLLKGKCDCSTKYNEGVWVLPAAPSMEILQWYSSDSTSHGRVPGFWKSLSGSNPLHNDIIGQTNITSRWAKPNFRYTGMFMAEPGQSADEAFAWTMIGSRHVHWRSSCILYYNIPFVGKARPWATYRQSMPLDIALGTLILSIKLRQGLT